MKKTNLFIVHTPFQAFIADHMVETMDSFRKGKNWALVDMQRLPDLKSSAWLGIHQIEPPIGIGFFGRSAYRTDHVLRETIDNKFKGKDITVFLSNVDYPIGNAFYRECLSNPRVSFASYPEGIANIAPGTLNFKKKLKNIVKQLYGQLVAVPYVSYGKTMAGFEQAQTIYTLFPDEVPAESKKIVAIPKPELSTNGEVKDGVLVIGQALGDFLGRSRHEQLTHELLSRASTLSDCVLYKPHPREGNFAVRLVRKRGGIYIDDNRIAELIFAEQPVRFVISFYSSALLHIKALYGEQVKCIAVCASEAIRSGPNTMSYEEHIRGLFQRQGVIWE